MRIVAEDSTIVVMFQSRDATGAPATLSGTPSLSIRSSGGATQITAGISLSVDFDSRTGLNKATIDLSASASYAAGGYFTLEVEVGTSGGVSVVGAILYEFEIGSLGSQDDANSWAITGIPSVAPGSDGGLAILASGAIPSNVTQLGGVIQSLTDLKDFADAGYDPASHKVNGVVLVDTVTALTNAVRLLNEALFRSPLR